MKDLIPYPYQQAGTSFILNNERCSLHVECGLGKTIMVLNAIDALIACGERHPVLVIAPLRVAQTVWKAETQKWNQLSYLKVSAIVGTPKERLAALNAEADIYCTNYENLEWLVEALKGKWPFRMVVADESTKLKSHRASFRQKKDGTATLVCKGGKRAAAIARLAFTKTKRWVNLTGTPTPQGLMDLWGQNWFTDKGAALGKTYTAFCDRWYKTGYNGFGLIMLPHAEKEIQEAIAPTTFTLRAEDYLTLGKEITNTIYVDLPPKARELYNDMERKLFIEIEAGEIEAFSAGVRSLKLRQIAQGAIYYDEDGHHEELHNAKLEALQSVVEEAAGMPLIVVYHFKSDLERLKKTFKNAKVLDKNPKTLYDFAHSKIQMLLVHPASAGEGVDSLQYGTNIIVFFSLDWNNGLREQVTARIGAVRQVQAGFNRPVIIHRIAVRDSIDEDIIARVSDKTDVSEALKAGLARRNLR
jgi:SNF2 family DNA or RNA helicase